ncbi:hypothetical protein ACFVUY_22125 [Kitasatospora sp. NPDC058063]|uniref:hypothetical protein n=1 Tax=unclassified Kitasatospora TaxID=2633591 RepID=UPI0036DF87FA
MVVAPVGEQDVRSAPWPADQAGHGGPAKGQHRYGETLSNRDSTYVGGILGPALLFGFGMGSIFVPVMLTAVSHVAPHETGAATGMLNTTQ